MVCRISCVAASVTVLSASFGIHRIVQERLVEGACCFACSALALVALKKKNVELVSFSVAGVLLLKVYGFCCGRVLQKELMMIEGGNSSVEGCETLQWTKDGQVTLGRRRFKLRSGEAFYRECSWLEHEEIDAKGAFFGDFKTSIEVVEGDSLDRAIREEGKVLFVLFGSPGEPGGGFLLNKHNGQEEQVCRRMELAGLMEYCNEHVQLQDVGRYNLRERALFIPDALVLRQSSFNQYKKLDEPVAVHVLASAAFYDPSIPIHEVEGKIEYLDGEQRNVMKKRIYNQFLAAQKKGMETIVLGAFGCGAFKNPPDAVASIYKEVIDEHFRGVFKKIIFSIVDDHTKGKAHNPRGNLRPFMDVFCC